MSSWIFAYGSNMCSGKLMHEGVIPESPGIPAKLRNHILVFNKESKDGSGKATLRVSDGTITWGVLYNLSDDYQNILDKNEGPGYQRILMEVQRKNGENTNAEVYFAKSPSQDRLLPYAWYKRFLILGAWEHRLPITYIVFLEAIQAEEDPDQDRDRDKRMIACEKLIVSTIYITKCLKHNGGIKWLVGDEFKKGDFFHDPHLMKLNECKIVMEVRGGNIYATDLTGPYPNHDCIILPTTEQLLDGCPASGVDLYDDVPRKGAESLFDAILKTNRFRELNGE